MDGLRAAFEAGGVAGAASTGASGLAVTKKYFFTRTEHRTSEVITTATLARTSSFFITALSFHGTGVSCRLNCRALYHSTQNLSIIFLGLILPSIAVGSAPALLALREKVLRNEKA